MTSAAEGTPPPGRDELRLHVQGMDCADEASLIRHVLDVPGILALEFDLVGRRVDVSFDPSLVSAPTIVALVGRTGLGVHTHERGEHVRADPAPGGRAHDHHRHRRRWALASGAFLVAGWLVDVWHAGTWMEALVGHVGGSAGHQQPLAAIVAYALSIVLGLWPVVPRALASIRFLRLDMHVLVCVSSLGAVMVGQWGEGAAVACLFAIAHVMEAWAIERARLAVSELVGHEPGWGDEGDVQSARVERWVERFAAVYTPVVTGSALTLVLVPPLFDGQWATWFYRGLIFLVLACPCALVISTPVTVVAALTSAARRGVLFKGGLALERAASDPGRALGRGEVVLMPGATSDGGVFAGAHARRALGVIRQNVGLALLTKAAFLVSATFGAAPLWLAVVADTGATVAVTLNGLRLLRARPPV